MCRPYVENWLAKVMEDGIGPRLCRSEGRPTILMKMCTANVNPQRIVSNFSSTVLQKMKIWPKLKPARTRVPNAASIEAFCSKVFPFA